MRTAMRPRYYCDFCKKGSGSPSHMKRHEVGCTIRADRTCGMCKRSDTPQRPLTELIPVALTGDIEALRVAASGCPACMLAAIRQAPWPTETVQPDGPTGTPYTYQARPEAVGNWDFKAACTAFWSAEGERGYNEGAY